MTESSFSEPRSPSELQRERQLLDAATTGDLAACKALLGEIEREDGRFEFNHAARRAVLDAVVQHRRTHVLQHLLSLPDWQSACGCRCPRIMILIDD